MNMEANFLFQFIATKQKENQTTQPELKFIYYVPVERRKQLTLPREKTA